ncbi:hypothetical protein MRX96_016253 [Rhipicephalus microplus]
MPAAQLAAEEGDSLCFFFYIPQGRPVRLEPASIAGPLLSESTSDGLSQERATKRRRDTTPLRNGRPRERSRTPRHDTRRSSRRVIARACRGGRHSSRGTVRLVLRGDKGEPPPEESVSL